MKILTWEWGERGFLHRIGSSAVVDAEELFNQGNADFDRNG